MGVIRNFPLLYLKEAKWSMIGCHRPGQFHALLVSYIKLPAEPQLCSGNVDMILLTVDADASLSILFG